MDSDDDSGFNEYSSNQISLASNIDDLREIQLITKVFDANIEKCMAELLESFDHLARSLFKVPRNDRRAAMKNHTLTTDE